MAEKLGDLIKNGEGTVALVTGTSANMTVVNKLFSFPNGFSADNSVIVSFMYQDLANTWRYVTYTNSNVAPITCMFDPNGQITVTTRDNAGSEKPIRILLMKF